MPADTLQGPLLIIATAKDNKGGRLVNEATSNACLQVYEHARNYSIASGPIPFNRLTSNEAGAFPTTREGIVPGPTSCDPKETVSLKPAADPVC
jgi:hypothetical protein